MHAVLAFVKSTLLGGLLFLLPLGIVVVVATRLFALARHVGDALHVALFPGAPSDLVPLVFAAGVLVALAFLAGMLARSAVGARLFAWLDGRVLGHVPAYALVRRTVSDLAGGLEGLSDDVRVVLVRLDDASQVGFLMERRADGTCVVFLPDAPSALAGTVMVVAGERLTDTDLAPIAVVQGMRRLGAGLLPAACGPATTGEPP